MEEDKVLNQEELQECECQEGEQEYADDRLIELEIYKETNRIEREEASFEFAEFPEKADEVSKEICRDANAYANFYTRLVIAGIHSDTVGQLLMNYMTTRHNIEMAKIDVEKAKYQSVQIQQSMV